MKLLLDTSVLIDHLRGDPRAVSLLVEAVRSGHELVSVVVVRTEILAGMRKVEEVSTQRLLDQIQWVEVTVELADLAGRLAQRFLKSHPGVDTVDYLIAAAAQALSADLKTQNVKHFPMFPGLARAYG